MNEVVLNIVISMISGIVSGAIVSYFFYFLGGKDLKREAREICRINGVVLRALRDINAEVEYKDGVPHQLRFVVQPLPATLKMAGGPVVVSHGETDGNVTPESE